MSYGLKRNGKLRRGCRFKKGGRVVCSGKVRSKRRGLRIDYGLKRNGKLQRGCRFKKGGRVVCNSKHRRKRRGLRG